MGAWVRVRVFTNKSVMIRVQLGLQVGLGLGLGLGSGLLSGLGLGGGQGGGWSWGRARGSAKVCVHFTFATLTRQSVPLYKPYLQDGWEVGLGL